MIATAQAHQPSPTAIPLAERLRQLAAAAEAFVHNFNYVTLYETPPGKPAIVRARTLANRTVAEHSACMLLAMEVLGPIAFRDMMRTIPDENGYEDFAEETSRLQQKAKEKSKSRRIKSEHTRTDWLQSPSLCDVDVASPHRRALDAASLIVRMISWRPDLFDDETRPQKFAAITEAIQELRLVAAQPGLSPSEDAPPTNPRPPMPTPLAADELKMLGFLSKNKGRIFMRDDLLNHGPVKNTNRLKTIRAKLLACEYLKTDKNKEKRGGLMITDIGVAAYENAKNIVK